MSFLGSLVSDVQNIYHSAFGGGAQPQQQPQTRPSYVNQAPAAAPRQSYVNQAPAAAPRQSYVNHAPMLAPSQSYLAHPAPMMQQPMPMPHLMPQVMPMQSYLNHPMQLPQFHIQPIQTPTLNNSYINRF